MSAIKNKHEIKLAIESFSEGSLTKNALNLFEILGYNTERQAPLAKPSYGEFREMYVEENSRFIEKNALVEEWKYIDLLFQLSKEEIQKQCSVFDTRQVDRTIMETYLFFTIELEGKEYNRTLLSQITREINKLFPMPVMILFKHGSTLTLSVINRRLNIQNDNKDVLEKVTLIKDLNIENLHRAHLDILFDLSFEELLRVYNFTNFVEMHNAWQKTLDTKELNKRFYQELSNWYFWSMREVYFPGAPFQAKFGIDPMKDPEVREHNAKNLIRLLTRILFVWFIKEKNLIPEGLFDENFIRDNLLINFEPRRKGGFDYKTQGSKYYRGILQNLFFGTLNQTVGKREFRKPGQHMNVTNMMRYESYFKDSKTFLKLVEETVPFMNGGLFECLDKPATDRRGRRGGDIIIYEDGFSDRKENELLVPDYIFFGSKEKVDLSEEFGNSGNNADVKGLIHILKSYKFTITENTPIEEDIALDPELLGRVFENLLASYNPETKTTARKQTGSFYTPREIVNYMVDESLISHLRHKLEAEEIENVEERIRNLISYSEKPNPFNIEETSKLISEIDKCKIVDPACGSGAFPMGILHKMVHILHKLDPKNELWKERQIEKANLKDDTAIREQLIEDIEAAFDNNELDYGRKLYLIENCIYGVDIQPIATQISKLRFFISLIVDQKVDVRRGNFGIRPLPNLETKFVAANTLIDIEKPKELISILDSKDVKALEEKLEDVRHRLFSAKTPTTKRKLREDDKIIRGRMGDLLVENGWASDSAKQIADWDPYDQNASSPFFDPEWIFGVKNGFDIVIGNPPYLSYYGRFKAELLKQEEIIFKNNYKFISERNMRNDEKFVIGRFNSIMFFIERATHILKDNGICSYIIDLTIHKNPSEDIRKFILDNTRILEIINNLAEFEGVGSGQTILSFQNIQEVDDYLVNIKDKYLYDIGQPYRKSELNFSFESPSTKANSIITKVNMRKTGSLGDYFPNRLIRTGITFTGQKDRFLVIVDEKNRKALIEGRKSIQYKYCKPKIVNYINYDKNLLNELNKEYENQLDKSKNKKQMWIGLGDELVFRSPKIIITQTGKQITATYSEDDICLNLGLFSISNDNLYGEFSEYNLKYFLAYLNSKLITYYAIKENLIFIKQGATPQIRLKDIKSIPIIYEEGRCEVVCKIVDEILSLTNADDYEMCPDKQTKVVKLCDEIDDIVYESYDVNPIEISMINDFVKENS